MSERKTFHNFSLADSYPRFMHSTDNIGNKYVEIELVDDLCTTKGRIATDSFIFHDYPDFSTMDPLSDEFLEEYFKLMKKLALCFEFISMQKIYDILRWKEYHESMPEHLKYPIVDGFMEMQYGPVLILIHHIIRHQMLVKERSAYKFAKHITHRMTSMVERRNGLHGYYIKRLYQLKEKKSCGPISNRAIKEIRCTIPFIPINGLSFVSEDDIRSVDPEYLARFEYNIREVRGIGKGVSLLDFIDPVEFPDSLYQYAGNSWYNLFEQISWGPLYPAILFADRPEDQVATIDLSFLTD